MDNPVHHHTPETPMNNPALRHAAEAERLSEAMRAFARTLLSSGEVRRMFAWEAGVVPGYPTPAIFTNTTAVEGMVYSRFCTANLSQYLIDESKRVGKILVFLRPCDAYSFARLAEENQLHRENIHAVGIGCAGIAEMEEGEERGLSTVCRVCTKKDHPATDETLGAELAPRETTDASARFSCVADIDALDEKERHVFWQSHIQRCIRCNACRNICPTCHCKGCILDDGDPFEKRHFHVIRALHQAGRCTDCGQCARVCPQKIPLHLLNRKLIQAAECEGQPHV